jgi:4-hydroxy-tetrahydrodipicolinate synthase
VRGVYTALVTPFDSRNELDLKAFRKILEDQVQAGVAGVVPCGTTGESPTLTLAEKKMLIHAALEVCRGSTVKVVAGTGSNNTAETVEFSKWASDQGTSGVLIVTPYYNKPSQQGMIEHFLAVAREVRCEVMLYNVPGRTGISLSSQTVCDLAEHPRITSIKEASGNAAFTSEILDCVRAANQNIDVLSGDDATFLPLLSIGAAGVVSVASNLFPRGMVAIQKAVEESRLQDATAIHQKYYPLFRDLFIESNPVPIKYAMSVAGFCDPRVRKPLMEMSASSLEKLRESLKRCQIQLGTRA